MADTSGYGGELRELSDEECLQLLAANRFGRICFVDDSGPIVLPVNYAVDGSSVLFATSPLSHLAQFIRNGAVAFEVDEADEFTRSGWSVMIRGTATFVDFDERPADPDARPDPWPAGARRLQVRVHPVSMSGRRLLPS